MKARQYFFCWFQVCLCAANSRSTHRIVKSSTHRLADKTEEVQVDQQKKDKVGQVLALQDRSHLVLVIFTISQVAEPPLAIPRHPSPLLVILPTIPQFRRFKIFQRMRNPPPVRNKQLTRFIGSLSQARRSRASFLYNTTRFLTPDKHFPARWLEIIQNKNSRPYIFKRLLKYLPSLIVMIIIMMNK